MNKESLLLQSARSREQLPFPLDGIWDERELWQWSIITGCKFKCPYSCVYRPSKKPLSQQIAQRLAAKASGISQHDLCIPKIHPERLFGAMVTRVPAILRDRPKVVSFITGELLGPWVPEAWIEPILFAIKSSPDWEYVITTKCPKRAGKIPWPSNVTI